MPWQAAERAQAEHRELTELMEHWVREGSGQTPSHALRAAAAQATPPRASMVACMASMVMHVTHGHVTQGQRGMQPCDTVVQWCSGAVVQPCDTVVQWCSGAAV